MTDATKIVRRRVNPVSSTGVGDCSQPDIGDGARAAIGQLYLVSKIESWITGGRSYGYGHRSSTGVMTEWQTFAKNARRHGVTDPKLVCIDIQPYGSSQAPERNDILNIGGFSDAVFNVVSSFMENDKTRFVREVENIEL